MEKKLYIKPFHLKINNHLLIENFSIDFTGRTSICLVGESGSGKTILLRTIKKYSPSCVSFYFGEESKTQNYHNELSNFKLSDDENEFIASFCKNKFFLKKKIALLKTILSSNAYLFMDDVHSFLNHHEFLSIFNFIKRRGIALFYVTSCIDDCTCFDYLLIIKDNKIAIEGKTLSVLKEEKLLRMIGYSLPFYVNLSIHLGYYGLLNKICLSKEELESELWK